VAGPTSRCWGLLCHIFRGKKRSARRCAASLPACVATGRGREGFGGRTQVIGNLPIEHYRNFTCGPRKPNTDLAVIVNRRENETTENYRHRHWHRTKRKPSIAPAVGRDKKNENDNPRSKKTQCGPPRQSLLLRATVAQERLALRLSRKRVNICLPAFLPRRPA
jgi:hypothetical protein